MFNNIQPVHAARQVAPAPTITIAPGCGFGGDQTVVMQVTINFWETKVSGAYLNAANGKWHRLAVTRMIDLAEYDEAADKLLRTKCGKKTVDRALRPDLRFDALLPLAGPYGLGKINLVPWMDAMRQLTEGLLWAIDAANTDKTSAFALLLVADITTPKHLTPERYPAYRECEVIGIRAAEFIKLEPADTAVKEVTRLQAPTPQPKPTSRRIQAASFSDDD